MRAGMALGSRTEKAQARKRERRTEALPEGMTSVCQGRLGHNACCTGCEAAVRQRLEKRGGGHAHNGSGTAHARQESAQEERTRSCKLPETQDAGIGHAVRWKNIRQILSPAPSAGRLWRLPLFLKSARARCVLGSPAQGTVSQGTSIPARRMTPGHPSWSDAGEPRLPRQ